MLISRSLCDRLEDDFGIRVHTNYSGRGMCGKECFGVSGDGSAIHSFYSAMHELSNCEDFSDEVCEFWDGNHSVCMDDLGLGIIIYFPGIQVAESDDDCEEDDYDEEDE